MRIQKIIKIIIGAFAIAQQYVHSFIIMDLENSTNTQIIKGRYTFKTLVTKNDVYENVTMATSSPVSVKRSKTFYNKGSPKDKQKNAFDVSSRIIEDDSTEWRCPNITDSRSLECSCDLPHTLRCNGDVHGLPKLADRLRTTPFSVALLDVSLRNVTFLSDAGIFDKISLRCLIISSGEIKRVHKSAFLGIEGPLLALGLPENALPSVPWRSISSLVQLERLDLSNNKIKALGTFDLANLVNLEYLDLSNNQLSSISQRSFVNVRKLEVLKLGGNRLGDYVLSLKALTQCYNLRDLDVSANSLNGPLTTISLLNLKNLATLNLSRNLIKSIQNKAFENFSKLLTLSLRHNQIDVLQDHAFNGLASLRTLDLSYNGIVAISGASLQHLSHLTTLDLTHNFLRALTSDLITPLPSLTDLRLSGNDISIVARNALDGALELRSISMQENPLSCDCTIREFSEWLQMANLVSQDILTITCATPPKLEGAPLLQVPIELLNCDVDNEGKDNANIIEQLEAIAMKNHSIHHIKDLSDQIVLQEVYFSTDYGLFLTWIINLSNDDYMCDAIFVYKEDNISEVLIDKFQIHCESKMVDSKNTVSVILPDCSSLNIGERYRFCLVMIREPLPYSDITVGCSNITQLQISKPDNHPKPRLYKRRHYSNLSKFDRSDETEYHNKKALASDFANSIQKFNSYPNQQEGGTYTYSQKTYNFLNSLNKSFLPGIGLGVLVTSLLVLIWGALRFRYTSTISDTLNANDCNSRRSSSPTTTTCYAASEHIARLIDLENQTRYLKLQATTSL